MKRRMKKFSSLTAATAVVASSLPVQPILAYVAEEGVNEEITNDAIEGEVVASYEPETVEEENTSTTEEETTDNSIETTNTEYISDEINLENHYAESIAYFYEEIVQGLTEETSETTDEVFGTEGYENNEEEQEENVEYEDEIEKITIPDTVRAWFDLPNFIRLTGENEPGFDYAYREIDGVVQQVRVWRAEFQRGWDFSNVEIPESAVSIVFNNETGIVTWQFPTGDFDRAAAEVMTTTSSGGLHLPL